MHGSTVRFNRVRRLETDKEVLCLSYCDLAENSSNCSASKADLKILPHMEQFFHLRVPDLVLEVYHKKVTNCCISEKYC